MRLLLVEDNLANIGLFQEVLEEGGHTVEVVRDGRAGYDRARAGDHDAILLDIQIPGMTGDAICRALRAEGLSIPIVALSAAALPDQIEAGRAAGFDKYLTKPISPRALREAIAALSAPRGGV